MPETQSQVVQLIEKAATSQGVDVGTFMSSAYGPYWHGRYSAAIPDEPQAPAPAIYKAEPTVETSGFIALRARAQELVAKHGITAQVAITKACEMSPELVDAHEREIRGAVGGGA